MTGDQTDDRLPGSLPSPNAEAARQAIARLDDGPRPAPPNDPA